MTPFSIFHDLSLSCEAWRLLRDWRSVNLWFNQTVRGEIPSDRPNLLNHFIYNPSRIHAAVFISDTLLNLKPHPSSNHLMTCFDERFGPEWQLANKFTDRVRDKRCMSYFAYLHNLLT